MLNETTLYHSRWNETKKTEKSAMNIIVNRLKSAWFRKEECIPSLFLLRVIALPINKSQGRIESLSLKPPCRWSKKLNPDIIQTL